ncbi:TetR/AcrR family transcriptional regulator [Dietzia psychralcaliphila]|uniref:TetR family transcriptional regulator n=1 Tax=Dietzia psychralcaliphila TaxID=139021 RepID=A0AAD0NNJ4_9ACTN|nr:TetR/AcrR family transcriptional regulator [Dietzia psychralcaliphila]AWH96790.1 TetR family transcriptional regulator [Dietzia psychralcaliphila]PTM89436.1 TetR family transcriptional regulator [Dietzia psychralcaliphila]
MTSSAPALSTDRTAGTRDRALKAAHTSILEIGATRTTMVEVARRSGVGRTTLYRHWPDITALFADLLTRELTAVVERVDPALPDSALRNSALHASALPDSAPGDADELVELLCTFADEVRADPLLDAFRRHESDMLSEYVFHRLGTSQRRLIDVLRGLLAQAIATDPRLAGRDADRTATMLFLAVQGLVLSAPLADPPLDPATWRTELHLLIKGYLGL